MKLKQNGLLGWIGVLALFIGIQFAVGGHLVKGSPPEFSATTLDGQAFELSRLRGRPAVIYFWAEWCPICRSMQHSIGSVAQDYPLLSVAMQSGNASAVGRYGREHDFNVPTVLDEDGSLAKRYGLSGVPGIFVLDANGQIRYATQGYTSELGLRLRLWLAGL